MSAVIHIGTQGWNYTDWVGAFFPLGSKPSSFLETYARAFGLVEIDSTFYAVPSTESVLGWNSRTPGQFRFTLKMPNAITRDAKLRDVEDVLALFLDRARGLGDKLGPILIQFGPDFGFEHFDALSLFLPLLPREMQFAVEFRRREWIAEGVLDLLRAYQVALALVDGPWIPRKWMLKLAEHPTASFSYIRLMGPDRSLTDHSRVQIDRSRELLQWKEAVDTLQGQVREIFFLVSNYYTGHAPATARDMQQLMGLAPVAPESLSDQMFLL